MAALLLLHLLLMVIAVPDVAASEVPGLGEPSLTEAAADGGSITVSPDPFSEGQDLTFAASACTPGLDNSFDVYVRPQSANIDPIVVTVPLDAGGDATVVVAAADMPEGAFGVLAACVTREGGATASAAPTMVRFSPEAVTPTFTSVVLGDEPPTLVLAVEGCTAIGPGAVDLDATINGELLHSEVPVEALGSATLAWSGWGPIPAVEADCTETVAGTEITLGGTRLAVNVPERPPSIVVLEPVRPAVVRGVAFSRSTFGPLPADLRGLPATGSAVAPQAAAAVALIAAGSGCLAGGRWIGGRRR